MSINKRIELNDGNSIPLIGLGCFRLNAEQMKIAIDAAVECGYRMFDTATRYENEKEVGDALRSCELKREDYYVVTKLWPRYFDKPEEAIEFSLRELNLDYIDAFYLHWPGTDRDKRLRSYEALLKYKEKGLIKSVGVSNFSAGQIVDLKHEFHVLPTVNQIEIHPWYPQNELADACRNLGVAVSAWGPIFHGHLSEVKELLPLAEQYGKSPAQITLRWHLQKGNIIIPKSSNPVRIRENAELFDFELKEADMRRIDALEGGGDNFGADFREYDGEDFVRGK